MFEWYMSWFGSKTHTPKKHVLKEIGLRVENMISNVEDPATVARSTPPGPASFTPAQCPGRTGI